jgi:hypothetical protein
LARLKISLPITRKLVTISRNEIIMQVVKGNQNGKADEKAIHQRVGKYKKAHSRSRGDGGRTCADGHQGN